jgi:general secretion pathway protein A
MGYYELLGLKKEPFSISPDPAFFYRSAAHASALQRLEISIRLRRGLSLIMGDVGTGKTTLGRVLLQNFQGEAAFDFHLVLNPLYQSEFQFLESLCKMFHILSPVRSTMDCLEALEHHLYQKGVVEKRTTVLLIDEGQNLSGNLIEVLRSLLNYETNEHKLLQLVIMAQLEALPRFQRIRNFMDRVSLKYMMNPFDREETRRMILFRLEQAGYKGRQPLFTDDAVDRVHEFSQGYPRKIMAVCQKSLEALIMQGRRVVDDPLVRRVLDQEVLAADED